MRGGVSRCVPGGARVCRAECGRSPAPYQRLPCVRGLGVSVSKTILICDPVQATKALTKTRGRGRPHRLDASAHRAPAPLSHLSCSAIVLAPRSLMPRPQRPPHRRMWTTNTRWSSPAPHTTTCLPQGQGMSHHAHARNRHAHTHTHITYARHRHTAHGDDHAATPRGAAPAAGARPRA